jgi:hypothetical protein
MHHGSRNMNGKFGDWNFTLFVESSLYVYISHYFWIAIVARILVVPTNMYFGINMGLLYIISEILILTSFVAILKLTTLVKKLRRKKEE